MAIVSVRQGRVYLRVGDSEFEVLSTPVVVADQGMAPLHWDAETTADLLRSELEDEAESTYDPGAMTRLIQAEKGH